MVGILVKGVVLQVISERVSFQVGIILFTALGSIGGHIFGQALEIHSHAFQEREEAGRITARKA